MTLVGVRITEDEYELEFTTSPLDQDQLEHLKLTEGQRAVLGPLLPASDHPKHAGGISQSLASRSMTLRYPPVRRPGHSQSLAVTLGDVTVAISQAAGHSQAPGGDIGRCGVHQQSDAGASAVAGIDATMLLLTSPRP